MKTPGTWPCGIRIVSVSYEMQRRLPPSIAYIWRRNAPTIRWPDAQGVTVWCPTGRLEGRYPRRATCDLEVEDVRGRIKQMLAEGASHQEVCRRLANAPRPARVAWKHLPWDKAYMERRFRSSVCKWL